jgi:asparagine synthase (glutamine-hydrolysing)
MCGIAGCFSFACDAAPVDADALKRVRDRMRVRGPDGEGLWVADDRQVAFAHRRLAIIDLSDRGLQPMHSHDGRYTVVFNGEIYNYRELKADLQARGHRFESQSDTEVLLALFAAHGVGMFPKLRGMFALAIWDRIERRLVLARDTFGIKPLYFANDGKHFWFASQVKALLETNVDCATSSAATVGFLLWGSVPEPHTVFRGIESVAPGHYVEIEQSGPRPSVAFLTVNDLLCESERNATSLSESEALAAVVEAVHDTVAAHHVADVPVGVFLSAGLDSAMLMSATARLRTNDTPSALTLGFDEYAGTANDETALAREIANITKARHRLLNVARSDFTKQRDALFEAMDQPTIDGINTWFVSSVARSNSIKVALSGLGGDEVFGSYPSFSQIPRIARYIGHFRNEAIVGKAIRQAATPLLKRRTSPKYAGLFEYGGTFEGAYLLRRSLYMPWEIAGVVGEQIAQEGLAALNTLVKLRESYSGIQTPRLRVSALEMQWYMRHQLLRDADWAGMGHSVEIRVPFVDIEFVRKTAAVFASHPQITKAQVARAVAADLPGHVLNRPKTGFTVPVREWMQQGAEMKQPPGERGLRGWANVCRIRYSSVANAVTSPQTPSTVIA